MIAGRFRWKAAGAPVPGKVGLLALDFEHGTLILTEAGTTRRASLHRACSGATRSQRTTPAASKCSTPTSRPSRPRCGARTTR